MNQMTWLDLYQFLHQQANNLDAIGTFDWSKPVIVHNAANGEECLCDTYYISDLNDSDRLVLLTNIEHIFNESDN